MTRKKLILCQLRLDESFWRCRWYTCDPRCSCTYQLAVYSPIDRPERYWESLQGIPERAISCSKSGLWDKPNVHPQPRKGIEHTLNISPMKMRSKSRNLTQHSSNIARTYSRSMFVGWWNVFQRGFGNDWSTRCILQGHNVRSCLWSKTTHPSKQSTNAACARPWRFTGNRRRTYW